MKKAPEKSATPPSLSPAEGMVLGEGWRVKERKVKHPAASAPPVAGLFRPLSANIDARPASLPVQEDALQRRRWCHPLSVLVGSGAVAVALIMSLHALPPLFNSSGVSKQASAESPASSTPALRQGTAALHDAPGDHYQLHLGVYQSDLGARLMWTGLEANPATLLDGLDPSFKPHQSEQGTVYHVLAGAFASHDDADNHCAWLKEQKIACSIVGG